MKLLTQGSTTLTALSLIAALALSLAASIQAADQKAQVQGSFHSAKDPDLPPLPFNPHPELSAVEVEKGVYVVDDTAIPDTAAQAAARNARQAAREEAKAIASNPLAAQAAQAASAAAQEASFATIIEEVSPWLHAPIKLPDGTPAPSLQDLTDAQAMITSSNADAIIAEQQAALDDAIAWGATNGWPAVIGTDDSPRGYLVSRDENGPQ